MTRPFRQRQNDLEQREFLITLSLCKDMDIKNKLKNSYHSQMELSKR